MVTYKSNKYLGLDRVRNRKISTKKPKNRFITGLICLVFAVLFSAFGKDDPKGIKIVVIDAGHGGKDPGCNGVNNQEKDVSLAVALKLGKYIEDNYKDIKVIYTRKTDVFVELEDRAQIANKNKADLFISIHCNAAGKPVMIKDKKTGKMKIKTYVNKKGKRVGVETVNPIPFGSETYVMGLKNEEGKMKVAQRENSVILLEDNYEKKYEGFDPESEESYIIMSNYTSAYLIQSAKLGLKIQEEYAKKAGRVDKGVHRQSIWVLWRTAMPSILTEIGYLTNPLEEQFLASEKGQIYVAASIFKGFRRYKDEVEGKKKEYGDDLENMEALENENLKAGNTGKTPKEDLDPDVEKEEPPVKDSVRTLTLEKPKTEDVKREEKNPDEKAAAEKLKKYTEIIKLADEKLNQKKYDDAEKLYTEAIAYKKENEAYPDQKLTEIAAVKTQAAENERKAKEDAELKARQKKEEEEKRMAEQKAKQEAELAAKQKKAEEDRQKENEKKEVTSSDLIKNYTAKKDSAKPAGTATVAVKEKEAKSESPKAGSEGIVFRVQFAGSEKELDLKQAKYTAIENGWYYKAGSTLKYTSGSFKLPEEAVKHQGKLREAGFKDCFVVAFKNGQRIDINEALKLAKENKP